MLCTKALHRNTQLYCSASVNRNKLVVGQLDNIAVLFCNDGSYLAQFARLVRKQNGNRKDTVSQNQTLLYDGGHGDHVHVAAA